MASYYIVLAARYITGIAALLSGDAFIAYRLHNGLRDEINKYKPIPPLEHVLISLKDILFRESIIKGETTFRKKNNIEKAKEYYDDADRIKNNDYQVLIFNSIYSFKVEKNPVKSLGFIKRAKNVSSKNYTWLYNKAFLHLYVENFDLGLKDLKKLRESSFDGEESVVDQCIDFDKELLGSEPDKKQFSFALGYLYYVKKNNLPLALEHFEKFLQEIRSDLKYESLRTRAVTYIDEIKKEMELKAKG